MAANNPSKKHDLLSEEQQNILKQKGAKIERLQTDIASLSKPLLENSTNWSKHVTPGTLSIFQEDSSWDQLKNPESGVLKRKGLQELREETGPTWKKVRDAMNVDSSEGEADYNESGSEEPSPTTTKLDTDDAKTFGALPMEEDIVVVKCKTCQRPILASSFKDHTEICRKKKGRKNTLMHSEKDKAVIPKTVFSDDEDDEMGTKSYKGNNSPALKKKKLKGGDPEDPSSAPPKRPPSTTDKPEKKKTKKEKQKQKATPKQKAPLDLDKQCGVIQGPNNTPCTRSLTCKSHSMGAKRAVAGRSEPYDVLLAAYQKKAIGRPQAGAVASTTAQKSVKNLKKLANQSKSPATSAAASAPHEEYVDSDEEVENVMQSLRLTRPAPLAERCYYFPKRRRQCYRLRDILLDAITPKAAPVIPVSDSNWSLLSMMSNTAGAGAEAATAPMHTGHYPFQNASGGTTRMGSHQSSPVSMIGFSQMDANTLFGSNAGMEPASPSSVSTYSSAR